MRGCCCITRSRSSSVDRGSGIGPDLLRSSSSPPRRRATRSSHQGFRISSGESESREKSKCRFGFSPPRVHTSFHSRQEHERAVNSLEQHCSGCEQRPDKARPTAARQNSCKGTDTPHAAQILPCSYIHSRPVLRGEGAGAAAGFVPLHHHRACRQTRTPIPETNRRTSVFRRKENP